jgi:hypothetical protein
MCENRDIHTEFWVRDRQTISPFNLHLDYLRRGTDPLQIWFNASFVNT